MLAAETKCAQELQQVAELAKRAQLLSFFSLQLSRPFFIPSKLFKKLQSHLRPRSRVTSGEREQ